MGSPRVSVCMLTRQASPALEACLRSLRAEAEEIPIELLVASDGDAAAVEPVRRHFPDAIVGLGEGAHLGHARNFLVVRARAELLWFLDDDVTVRPGSLGRLIELSEREPEVDVFGGPNLTPPGSGAFEVVQGAVLASVVGSGPVRRRYGRRRQTIADERFFILCNMAIRRSAMLPFPAELRGGEENALLTDLSRAGARMLYDPKLVVYHERRPTFRGFAAQMHKYGVGRGQVIRRRPREARPAYLAPVALIGCAAVGAPLALVNPLLLAPLGVYAAAMVAQAVKIGIGRRRVSAALLAAVLLVTLHVCYGLGVISGLSRRPRPRLRQREAVFALVTDAEPGVPQGPGSLR